MRKLILLVLAAILGPTAAFADTQTAKQARLSGALVRYGRFPSSQAGMFLSGVANVLYYDTATELLAASPAEGIIGYAIDTNAFYLRSGSSWVGLSGISGVTGDNGGDFSNGSNNVWSLSENSETLLLTFGTNKVTLSSSSGLNVFDFGAVVPTLENGATIANGTNNAIAFGENSEDLVLTFGTNSATWSSTTGVTNFGLGSLPILWTNGGTISNATNGALIYSETSEDLVQTFTSNTITMTSTTGVDTLAYSGIGVDAPTMAATLTEIRFCGNGPNGTTATYVGPVLPSDSGTDMSFSSTACDAKDSTTEATGDLAWNAALSFRPVAMVCTTTCGTDDTMTFQLRDDTADVTGMTCSLTLTGSATQCVVRDATPATVAANSQIAIKITNSVNDNCSAGDIECRVFVDYAAAP